MARLESWTPTTTYRIDEPRHRAVNDHQGQLGYRADRPVGADEIPSIRARRHGRSIEVSADGPVQVAWSSAASMQAALAGWADRFRAVHSPAPLRVAPTVWCSWYQCFTDVTAGDITENLQQMDRHDLAVDVVQIDDGYQAEIGDSFLTACGAPTLASIGLVDAMRVSADTAPYVEPASGDLSAPGQRGALMNGRARAWQNGRFWHNDPDCLIARPEVAQRETWAEHAFRCDGLRSISDRIVGLDDWGLATTRSYLDGADSPPAEP